MAIQQLENSLSVSLVVNGYLFQIVRLRQGRERNGFSFPNAVLKTQWASNPHYPYSYRIRLWETLPLPYQIYKTGHSLLNEKIKKV